MLPLLGNFDSNMISNCIYAVLLGISILGHFNCMFTLLVTSDSDFEMISTACYHYWELLILMLGFLNNYDSDVGIPYSTKFWWGKTLANQSYFANVLSLQVYLLTYFKQSW